ncbi:hypothetical protein DFQ01_12187 [Paenibacillus cellulosilyticus]|uniref:Uncharacterized protein n=1 Tax=Paenibacillus cellulosilyticus TaxID=375489 RepID=A0A2V2YXU9_9BACL|nr:hypothetical protein [Paenibacillus cellulosilyticus]PWV97443.1 hypothetical protein DFQ01_12187 [Paenibacillus cellulosilyticus]QKS48519.1 hypothetical protein HUB94_30250 [Paenibacillus cellulosilyticus]
MLYAIKGNKQLKIDEADKAGYLKLGYDIAEEQGGALETIETSPSKTVTYAEHKKALDRNEELEEQLASMKTKLTEANKKLKEATGG